MEGNVVIGPPLERSIDGSLGEILLPLLKVHGENVLQVDIDTEEQLTALTLLKRAVKLSKWFKNEGIKVGDSVSINSENRLEFAAVPVAAFFLGVTFAPLNPDYTPRELKHVINLSKPKMIFCSPKTVDKLISVMPDHPNVKKLVLFGQERRNHSHVVMFNDIMGDIESEEVDEDFEAVKIDPKETVATILCSSGTTGMPKGVMCTHDNMTAFIEIGQQQLKEFMETADPEDPDAIMGLVPFFHSFGFMLMFLNILRGKLMVVLGKFKPKPFLDAIVKYRISRLIVPPPVFLFLLKHPLAQQYDLSCIKEMRSGAAPLGAELEKALKEKFRVHHVSQGYGMTETTLAVLVTPHGKAKSGSCGVVVPGMMAKVIDDNGVALGKHQEGELCFKGPLIMKGYVGDPEATRNTIDADGWLHTGDVAYYDDDGYFYIVDRIKELIKYKGFQVAPAELEALLLTHPSVQDAAVVGLPDEMAGELPLAYVVRKPEKRLTEADVERFVEENVSPQKRLRGGVIFVDEIPRNPTGKILRRVLRDRAKKLKSKL